MCFNDPVFSFHSCNETRRLKEYAHARPSRFHRTIHDTSITTDYMTSCAGSADTWCHADPLPDRASHSHFTYLYLSASTYFCCLDCLISDTRWETRNGIGQLPPYIVSQWLTDGIWRGFDSFVWQQWVESELVESLQQPQHHLLPNYSEEEINPPD